MKRVLNILILFILATAGLMIVFLKSNFTTFKIKEEPFILLVKKGDNLQKISRELDASNIYTNSNVLYYILRIVVGGSDISAGEYEFLPGDGVYTLVQKLKNKTHYYRQIRFIEGEIMLTYKEQINNAYGLFGEITKDVKEGYFLPGTYNYLYGETKNSILTYGNNEMLNFVNQEFDKVIDKEAFYLKNINEILSLASVVEKETGIDAERKLIAGVFYNRLKLKMRLQSDPTVIYEITQGKYKLDKPLTYVDLRTKGDYNTYYISGIPIAPISSPGKASIIAVLQPQKTDYLFFVADGIGGHNFSQDYEEHKENIKNYRQVLKNKNEAR